MYVTLLSLGPNTAMKTIPVPAVDDHPPQESDTPTFSGRESEAVIGGSFGQDPKVVITRINRKTPDQRSVGKSKRDRLRKARKPEKDLKEKEQREKRSAKKRLRRQQQLSEDPEAREFKTEKKVDNGDEKVTPEIRRLLGKSHKPKIVNKRRVKDIEASREIAELTRRKHKEQESSKWKSGMRVAAHEDRQQRRKKLGQVTTDCVRLNFDIESQNLPCSQATFPDGSEVGLDSLPSSPPQSTATSTQATFPESYGSKFTDNHILPSTSPPQSTTASVVSSQATFSDLYRSTFPDNNQILPSTSSPQSTTASVVSSQATFPETPHTTFTDSIYVLPSSRSPDLTESSSSDTESVSTTVQKSKVLVKRSAKVRPSLSDSSNTGKFKYNDFIGGGSFYSEAIESHKKVKALLNTLKRAITNSGLPLTLDMETPIDGNCFPESVIQQCQRQEVQDILVSQKKRITDYMTLRKDVADFVISNGDHPKIQHLKNNYELKQLQRMRGGLSNKGWTYYWQDMRKDGEWVDATFVQATAWFTGLDIFLFIVGNENPDNPFAHFNGVVDSDEVRPRGDHTLLIGYIDDQHYLRGGGSDSADRQYI